jgi:hypothetical protein
MAKRARKKKATKKEKITLPPDAPRGSHIDTGKGWRLVNPRKTRTLKASVISTFTAQGEKYVVLRRV